MNAYQINIGARSAPRLSFGCMAPSSAVAVAQHIELAEEGERVEAVPVGREPFPVIALRQELEVQRLRDLGGGFRLRVLADSR